MDDTGSKELIRMFYDHLDVRVSKMENKIDRLMESRALTTFLISGGTAVSTSILGAIIIFFVLHRVPGG